MVYVDDNPVAFVRAQELMATNDETAVVQAHLRDIDEVLRQAGKLLDFSKPTALMFVASLHDIADEDDPAAIVARYLARLAPESYLVLSQFTEDFNPEKVRAAAAESGK